MPEQQGTEAGDGSVPENAEVPETAKTTDERPATEPPTERPDAEPAVEQPEAGQSVEQLLKALLREPEVGERAVDAPPASESAPAPDGEGSAVGRKRRRTLLPAAVLLGVVVVVVGALVLSNGGAWNEKPTASSSGLVDLEVGPATAPGTASTSVTSAASSANLGSGVASSSDTSTALSQPPTPDASTPSPSATPTPAPSPSPDLAPDGGVVVFGDDFMSGDKGWPTGSLTALTSLSYSASGYAIAAEGSNTDHLIASPWQTGYSAVVVTVSASLSSGRGTAGFGVTCETAGSGSAPAASPSGSEPGPTASASGSGTTYEFIVLNDGGWLVEHRDGSLDQTAAPTVLMHGTTATVPGVSPISVSGICATSADGHVRLALYLDDIRLTEITDVPPAASVWRGGIVVTTGNVAATVTVRSFKERDLG